ncbi:hypothetical protein GNI_036140 [Gregarina niphandrodes]|uniref:Uncharacterized protein n=1 Tax=Gregarina niphandrodes TaxID=110365 RepID=A0A023BAP5_GRENI|nr:hypothetical protein GNI_036140 [Gregarina niphandrodes]EZG78448.1 hypothetical protein GNI_036140 [Gregarina niphandrodes]|eukprot:XP_011129296.1 hypothetical protein GNI_036140 [Gregarina niphandrodes]
MRPMCSELSYRENQPSTRQAIGGLLSVVIIGSEQPFVTMLGSDESVSLLLDCGQAEETFYVDVQDGVMDMPKDGELFRQLDTWLDLQRRWCHGLNEDEDNNDGLYKNSGGLYSKMLYKEGLSKTSLIAEEFGIQNVNSEPLTAILATGQSVGQSVHKLIFGVQGHEWFSAYSVHVRRMPPALNAILRLPTAPNGRPLAPSPDLQQWKNVWRLFANKSRFRRRVASMIHDFDPVAEGYETMQCCCESEECNQCMKARYSRPGVRGQSYRPLFPLAANRSVAKIIANGLPRANGLLRAARAFLRLLLDEA